MKIIGLTGGIASGKSTVSKELNSLGAVILDADKIAWQLAEPDNAIWQAYYERYGKAVINEDRSLNRQAVADRVFSDKAELKWMNEMAHPLIKNAIENKLTELKLQSEKADTELIVVLDVPLLFESGWQNMADESWLVYTTYELQVARLKSRNNIDAEEAKRRIDSQMSLEKKKALADFLIANTGTKEDLLANIHSLWQQRIKNV